VCAACWSTAASSGSPTDAALRQADGGGRSRHAPYSDGWRAMHITSVASSGARWPRSPAAHRRGPRRGKPASPPGVATTARHGFTRRSATLIAALKRSIAVCRGIGRVNAPLSRMPRMRCALPSHQHLPASAGVAHGDQRTRNASRRSQPLQHGVQRAIAPRAPVVDPGPAGPRNLPAAFAPVALNPLLPRDYADHAPLAVRENH